MSMSRRIIDLHKEIEKSLSVSDTAAFKSWDVRTDIKTSSQDRGGCEGGEGRKKGGWGFQVLHLGILGLLACLVASRAHFGGRVIIFMRLLGGHGGWGSGNHLQQRCSDLMSLFAVFLLICLPPVPRLCHCAAPVLAAWGLCHRMKERCKVTLVVTARSIIRILQNIPNPV